MEVSLPEMLKARENRVCQQQLLLSKYRVPLICFTMNIAGPIKVSSLIRRGFDAGLSMLDSKLPQNTVLHRQIIVEPTGCEAMYAVALPAEELKALCTAIEEASPLGRLFDMDVLNTAGNKLQRQRLRGCLVCGAPGRGCAAGRLHTVDQLHRATTAILRDHFAQSDRTDIAQKAVQSLLDEVSTTPKPGLVDMRNNGSHRDMTPELFTASAHALLPYFEQCVKLGQETARLSPADTFPLLRQAGLAAEDAMYQVTGGVNTHKGAIYTLGVLCGALGRLWTPEDPVAPVPQILSQCAELTQLSVSQDLATADGATAGQRLYLTCGLKGIRGEVANGLPSVANIGLPVLKDCLARGLALHHAGAVTLLHLIATVEDTNLRHRGGEAGAAWAAQEAGKLLRADPFPAAEKIEILDDAFIERNLSPGGCADLLAVSYFLHSLSK